MKSFVTTTLNLKLCIQVKTLNFAASLHQLQELYSTVCNNQLGSAIPSLLFAVKISLGHKKDPKAAVQSWLIQCGAAWNSSTTPGHNLRPFVPAQPHTDADLLLLSLILLQSNDLFLYVLLWAGCPTVLPQHLTWGSNTHLVQQGILAHRAS